MKEKVKSYIVSSANWEFEIDDINFKSAAISAAILAFSKFGKNLLMSTVVMVSSKEDNLNNELEDTEFFPTSKILREIGQYKMSEGFIEYNKIVNEIKSS